MVKTIYIKRKRIAGVISIAFLFAGGSLASAAVVDIGPFTGLLSESFESFPTGPVSSPITIMGGNATIANPNLFIYSPSGATFGIGIPSVPAQVQDGANGLGINNSNDTAAIFFVSPVTRFGGYWGSGSPSNGVTFNFFDASSNLIGSEVDPYTRNGAFGGDGGLDWHGWSSSTPIAEVTYSGDYVVADALQAQSQAPEPATFVLAGIALAAFGFARRRRTA